MREWGSPIKHGMVNLPSGGRITFYRKGVFAFKHPPGQGVPFSPLPSLSALEALIANGVFWVIPDWLNENILMPTDCLESLIAEMREAFLPP
jgi:hypothetical protein